MERTAGQVLATLGAVILAAGGGTAIAAGATYAGLSSSPTGHNGTSDYVSIGRINNEATATVVIAPVGLALTVAGIILLTRSP